MGKKANISANIAAIGVNSEIIIGRYFQTPFNTLIKIFSAAKGKN